MDSGLVCPAYPVPPASALLNISSIDDPMCPGNVAKYSCIAGGLNAFKVPDFNSQQSLEREPDSIRLITIMLFIARLLYYKTGSIPMSSVDCDFARA